MKKFKQLGRSLSSKEQKSVFGGYQQSSIVCTCSDGSSSTCNGSMGDCLGEAIRNCDGNRVFCVNQDV